MLLDVLVLLHLDSVLLLPRLQATVVKCFDSLDKSGWYHQVAAYHPVLVQRIVAGLVLGPFAVRQIAVVACLWFGWREAALLWVAFPWLFALGLFLVSRLLEWRFPARSDVPVIPADLSNCGFYSATDPDFEQRVVTAGNCEDFGLTPEQVEEIAGSDTPFKPAAPSEYTFFSVEGFDGAARMVIAERDRPEAPVLPPTNPPTEAETDEQPSDLDVLLEGLNQEQGTELLTLVREQGLDANDPILGLIAIGLRNVEREAAFIEHLRLHLTAKNKN